MEELDPAERLQIGKSNLRLLIIAILLVMLGNVVLSLFYWITWGALIGQLFGLGVSVALVLLLMKGYSIRWYLIALLLFTAFGYFFIGGQRAIFEASDGGFAALCNVGSALALIGTGIFLGANEEVFLYLQSIAIQGEKED